MDLTEQIDFFLPRLSRRTIRRIACDSWGYSDVDLRTRVELRCLELLLSLHMLKPEKEFKWTDQGRKASGYPVTYHNERLLIFPAYGVERVRTYVLFNAMSDLLKKR